MLRRGDEILICRRVSTVPSFPDYWAFPGGGVSRVDRAALAAHPEWFTERDDDERVALVALLREIVEEVGLAPVSQGFVQVDSDLRLRILSDKKNWLNAVESAEIGIDAGDFILFSERTTPPLAPLRFRNHFFTVECEAEPILEFGERPEFDEYRWATPQQLLDEWNSHLIRIPPPLIMILRELCEGPIESSIKNMAKSPQRENVRIEFAPGVECLPIPTATLPPSTHTNCYILGEPGGQRVIVDPAARDEDGLSMLKEKIKQVLESGSEIIATIFTHRHKDHVGNLDEISEIYVAPIWATQETLASIPHCELSSIISEGESFTLSGVNGQVKWDIIETPGHCPGQICLISQAGIISADNVAQIGTILVPSNEGDMTTYIQGLHRLREIDANLLFPGHGPVVTNPNRLLSHYIKHREKRHESVFSAWKRGLRDINEISDEAYGDTPDAHPALKLDQTKSHLDALRKEGRIQ
jgi:glyoxylase-like metal-dependent hydrolase (beta-lactamase superfamily II)/8-oxo-dGTP pyrophosphatase MutT (NUDIX family)